MLSPRLMVSRDDRKNDASQGIVPDTGTNPDEHNCHEEGHFYSPEMGAVIVRYDHANDDAEATSDPQSSAA